jgi:hypothetical protein
MVSGTGPLVMVSGTGEWFLSVMVSGTGAGDGFRHWTFIFGAPRLCRTRSLGDCFRLLDRFDAPPLVGRLFVRAPMAVRQVGGN